MERNEDLKKPIDYFYLSELQFLETTNRTRIGDWPSSRTLAIGQINFLKESTKDLKSGSYYPHVSVVFSYTRARSSDELVLFSSHYNPESIFNPHRHPERARRQQLL